MAENISEMKLDRLRQYMADEAERLGKLESCKVHRVDLDEVDEKPKLIVVRQPDPLERDLDVLFESSDNSMPN